MAVINRTSATIRLPSRHKLRPGLNAGATARLLEAPVNAATVAALVAEGRIAVVEAARRGALAQETERTFPPFRMPEGPLSRLSLAALTDQGVVLVARREGVATEGRGIDEVRLDMAERLFG